MLWARRFWVRLQTLFRRNRSAQRLEDEIQFHLDQQIADNLAAGMSAQEARCAAMRAIGNPTFLKEETRDTWGWVWLEQITSDLRYAVRMLGKSPGFTAVAMLTLALGIGANTALFTIVNGVLLNPLPYFQPNQLVVIYQRTSQFQSAGVTYPNFLDWQKQNRSFSLLGAYSEHDFNLTGGGEPEKLRGQLISAGFFSMLGVKPLLGRTIRPEEDRLGANAVVLLAEGLWKRRFASSPDILGHRLTLYGKAYTVVGVVPGDAPFFRPSDVFVPIGAWDDPTFRDRRFSVGMSVIGRLKPGLDLRQAQADMDAIARKLESAFPEADKGVGIRLVPLKEDIVGDVQRVLLLMLGAVGFVLLIACANVAGLLLARSAARRANSPFA